MSWLSLGLDVGRWKYMGHAEPEVGVPALSLIICVVWRHTVLRPESLQQLSNNAGGASIIRQWEIGDILVMSAGDGK